MPKTAHASPGRFSSRATGILLAALLQAGFVYALVEGLDINSVVQMIPGPVTTFFPKERTKSLPPPPPAAEQLPVDVFVPKPDFDIEGPARDTAPTGFSDARPQSPGLVDHGPVSLMATHTIPPYPALDARLGNQGTVLLHLVIGSDGRVRAADVVRSSGFPGLDQAAEAWVMAHWRYQPALKGENAVESAANVAVTFNLKNAG